MVIFFGRGKGNDALADILEIVDDRGDSLRPTWQTKPCKGDTHCENRTQKSHGIFEVLSNAVIHAETKLGIFACGQFFPKSRRLDFSIADLGIGMRENIKKKRGLDLTPEAAIVWATEGNNTTKTGNIPGGLGLKLLRDFVSLNKGRIQIVSDAGYWELANGMVTPKRFEQPFPGTVVNLEINAADRRSYCLQSEQNLENIF